MKIPENPPFSIPLTTHKSRRYSSCRGVRDRVIGPQVVNRRVLLVIVRHCLISHCQCQSLNNEGNQRNKQLNWLRSLSIRSSDHGSMIRAERKEPYNVVMLRWSINTSGDCSSPSSIICRSIRYWLKPSWHYDYRYTHKIANADPFPVCSISNKRIDLKTISNFPD